MCVSSATTMESFIQI